jgi:four helix bundle protein
MEIGHYEKLDVWRESVLLVKLVYFITSLFPEEEKYGLIKQMRRAAIAIPSHIAEGQQRDDSKDYVRLLSYAKGAIGELKTHSIIAVELELVSKEESLPLIAQIDRVGRQLRGLYDSLRKKQYSK